MTTYELMIKTNHYIIQGGNLTEKQKANIVGQLLSARSTPDQTKRFYNGVKVPNNIDDNGRRLYPMFYIPPFNGGMKLKTILNQTPKTQLLSANMYELEILRLLHLFAPHNHDVSDMIRETLQRLKTTCFGYKDDGVGECFDASLVVLRFISTVAANEPAWIISRINNFNKHFGEKKRPWFSLWYYWLCLSEMPLDIAQREMDQYKDEMLNRLSNRSYVMNSETDKMIHPVIISILRNVIARYPEYEFIKCREPYISEKDGRLHFNMMSL